MTASSNPSSVVAMMIPLLNIGRSRSRDGLYSKSMRKLYPKAVQFPALQFEKSRETREKNPYVSESLQFSHSVHHNTHMKQHPFYFVLRGLRRALVAENLPRQKTSSFLACHAPPPRTIHSFCTRTAVGIPGSAQICHGCTPHAPIEGIEFLRCPVGRY